MSQLEDKFKDAFDHFEPEVDPGVWAKISTQLPSAPSSVVNGGAAAAKLGIKGLAALLAAAAITVSVLYWKASKDQVQPASSGQQQQQTIQPATPDQTPDVPVAGKVDVSSGQSSAAVPAGIPSSERTAATINTTTAATVQKNSIPGEGHVVPVLPNASAGSGTSGNGGAAATLAAPVSGEGSQPAQNAVAPAPEKAVINNRVSPVLILSATAGFAPFTVTAITNQQGIKADYDFGDGSSSFDQVSATHAYAEAGDYTISCTVDGITLRKNIRVAGKIPSAFSPNGDGVNDVFEIENADNMQLEIRIFTRTGRLVYSGKGVEISWDGRQPDGSMAEAGTYLYDIFANSGASGPIRQKGTLYLFK